MRAVVPPLILKTSSAGQLLVSTHHPNPLQSADYLPLWCVLFGSNIFQVFLYAVLIVLLYMTMSFWFHHPTSMVSLTNARESELIQCQP